MRVLFIGTVEFSLKVLEKLVTLDCEVVGVCTKEKSKFNSDFADLTMPCKKHNIPYIYVKNINSPESLEWIKDKKPDVIFCFGWSSLIKTELLNLSQLGVIGYHPANLPKNRGRHPFIWALALGLKKSASTFFFMEEGADDGDILSQVEFSIDYDDNARSIYDKVLELALNQVEDFVPKLKNGTYKKAKQNHKLANIWRKRGIKDGEIDFRMSSNAIYNLVRALTKPYVGAHINYQDNNVSIWEVKEVTCELNNIEPGKVLESSDNVFTVKTYDNAIEIISHEFTEIPKKGEYL